ncbi:thioredoxin-like protein, partial [Basidiobolus meristosporus CBS 931.73]
MRTLSRAATRSFNALRSAFLASSKEGQIIDATAESFHETLQQCKNSTVLIYFYADWCGPCRMVGPALKKAMKEAGNLVLIKVNVDEVQEVAAIYDINNLPSILMMSKNQVTERLIGMKDERTIRDFVDRASKMNRG